MVAEPRRSIIGPGADEPQGTLSGSQAQGTAEPAGRVLPWRSRTRLAASDRPYHAPDNRLGAARGLILGLAIGTAFWVLIGIAVWRVLL